MIWAHNMQLYRTAILVFLLLAWSIKAWSQSLNVVCNENVVPFCFVKDGKTVGIFVDVVKELGARMEVKVSVKPMPMKRLLLKMKDGSVDMAGPILYRKERTSFVDYLSTPVFTIRQALYGRKADYFPYHSVEDLYGKLVGKRRGFHIEKEFASAEDSGKIQVLEANNFPQLFNLLTKKRVKYIIFPGYLASLNREQLPSDAVVFGYLGGTLNLLVSVSRKSEWINRYDEMNQLLKDLNEDGTLKRISDNYLGQ